MTTFHECWECFSSRAIPADTPHEVRLRLKKSYYSGALGLLHLMHDMPTSDMRAAAAMLESWHKEIETFMKMGGMSS